MATLFTLLMSSSVLADDGRINRAPYHFGGDTLYCNQQVGCTLLNKIGLSLANWPQDDIGAAIAATDQLGVNTQVGVRQGTYGSIELWVVSPDATTGNNILCLIGFDEWAKQNDMCFQVTPDYQYQQAALPAKVIATPVPTAALTVEPTSTSEPTSIPTATATGTPTATATSTPTATATSTPAPADCSMWTVGDTVQRIGNSSTIGNITSIDSGAGTLTVGASYTAGCDEVEWAY